MGWPTSPVDGSSGYHGPDAESPVRGVCCGGHCRRGDCGGRLGRHGGVPPAARARQRLTRQRRVHEPDTQASPRRARRLFYGRATAMTPGARDFPGGRDSSRRSK